MCSVMGVVTLIHGVSRRRPLPVGVVVNWFCPLHKKESLSSFPVSMMWKCGALCEEEMSSMKSINC